MSILQKHRNRKDAHIAAVMENEINPELYLQRERDIRRGKWAECLGIAALILLAFAMLKVWFVAEGFTIQW